MNTEISRNYHFSDATMLNHSKTAAGNLEADLADFTAFDATMNDEFVTGYKAQLVDVEADVSDNVIVDQQAQLTEEANKNLAESIRVVTDMTYFINKAFKSKVIHNQFGLNNLAEAKKSKPKMILFLRDFSKMTQKYKPELETAGAMPELFTSVDTIYKKLNDTNREQELFMSNRPVITQERVIKYNALWEKTLIIAAAAKIVYRNNLAKQKRYLTPKQSSKDYSIKVAPNAKVAALTEGVADNLVLEVKNTGKLPLVFFVANTADAPIPEKAITIAAGETKTVTTESISNGTYGQLIVANQNGSESAYTVQVLE